MIDQKKSYDSLSYNVYDEGTFFQKFKVWNFVTIIISYCQFRHGQGLSGIFLQNSCRSWSSDRNPKFRV